MLAGTLSACGPGEDRTPQFPRSAAQPWFVEITSESGVDFVHETGASGELWLPEVMGGGVALFDCDGDGRLDLYFVDCGGPVPVATEAEAAPARRGNRLYRQQAPLRFVDATEGSGLDDPGYGMGVAVGDVDNDGRPDVYVTNLGPDQLYRNLGAARFTRVTQTAGIDVPGWSCSAAFFDANRDGALDLFVTQYVHFDPARRCTDATGRRMYCNPHAFAPASDVLLVNRGDGTFRDASREAGIAAAPGSGLGVVVEDFDDDGWPDVYVANDGNANHLWLNQRDGTFRDVAVLWGAAFNMYGRTEAGMGVVAGDLRGEGLVDLFLTHLENESNTLYARRGGGPGFDDVTALSGLGHTSMARTGFGVAAFDATLDGRLDLLVVNGRVTAGRPLPGARQGPPWDQYSEPNLFYRGDGKGRFTLLTDPVAALCEPVEISRGLAVGDLDGDGRLDVVVANIQGPPRIYLSRAPREGRWLVVRAIDARLGRDAVGARVRVEAGGRAFTRTISGGQGYLSAGDASAHFGLGRVERIDRVDVRWPDGRREHFGSIGLDQLVELRRGAGEELP